MDHALSTHLFVNHRLTTALLTKIQSAGIGAVEIFCARQHLDYHNKAQISELGHWFRDPLRPLMRDVCGSDAIRRGGLFRPEAVERLMSEHESRRRAHRKKLYTLIAFQLWASRYRLE